MPSLSQTCSSGGGGGGGGVEDDSTWSCGEWGACSEGAQIRLCRSSSSGAERTETKLCTHDGPVVLPPGGGYEDNTSGESSNVSLQSDDGTESDEEGSADKSSLEDTSLGSNGKRGLSLLLFFIAGIILVSAAVASAILVMKGRDRGSLVVYVRYMLKKKYSKDQIIKDLTNKKIPRKEIESVLKEAMIANYYTDQKSLGKTKEQVEQELERAGWDAPTIEKTLKKEK
jgi:hypothetical protein